MIDSNDIFQILKLIVGKQLDDEKLLVVIKKTMKDDLEGNGIITFE